MLDRIQTLEEFCREREEWRERVGITDKDDWEMRNSGTRQTPEKREFLRRMAERSRAAGIEPFPANY